MIKVNTPVDSLICIAASFSEYVVVSPSGSIAVAVPIAVWFSAALKVADEVNAGASSTSVTLTVIF